VRTHLTPEVQARPAATNTLQHAKHPRSVSVIGGGVVGLCVALSLQERGFSVVVFDATPASPPASWGNAGRIAVESVEPLASMATVRALPRMLFSRGGAAAFPLHSIGTWLPFGLRFLAACTPARFEHGKAALRPLLADALPAWRRRVASAGAPSVLREIGHLSIWEDAGRYRLAAAAWQRDAGAATAAQATAIELEGLQKLVRVPLSGALKFSGTASIADPGELLSALRTAFQRRGGTLRQEAADIRQAMSESDAVVVAAGNGSRALLRAIGHAVPLIAERGYHIQQADPDWPSEMPPIHFEDREVVVTRFRSFLRATSFVEFSTDEAPPDARKWTRLRQHLQELGLPIRTDATEWMGSRPTLPDYLPAIGRSEIDARVYYAFGHQHLGVTLAAVTGERLAALVSADASGESLEAFNLARFAQRRVTH
jgi:D-hydroxyproline dehydrogenase